MDSVDKATSAIPESMPQQTEDRGNGDGTEQEVAIETKKEKMSEITPQQDWSELVSTGLSFLDKLSQKLLGEEGKSNKPISNIFSRLKIEKDKTTDQQQLRIPVPSKKVLKGIADILTEFSKKM